MNARAATERDAQALEDWLKPFAETSMFLRANLRDHGAVGGEHPHATEFWILGDWEGVIGLSRGGFVKMQLPGGLRGLDLKDLFAGRTVSGMTGPPEQVDLVSAALGLPASAIRKHEVEPLFRLNLDKVRVPEGPGKLRSPVEEDRESLWAWRTHYLMETFDYPDQDAKAVAAEDIANRLEAGHMRLLAKGSALLSTTDYNAALPDMVQLGGVYTPPERRNRGHARRAVALQMLEAREQGVEEAILFSANEAAARAYVAVGFERIGSYALLICNGPQEIN